MLFRSQPGECNECLHTSDKTAFKTIMTWMNETKLLKTSDCDVILVDSSTHQCRIGLDFKSSFQKLPVPDYLKKKARFMQVRLKEFVAFPCPASWT